MSAPIGASGSRSASPQQQNAKGSHRETRPHKCCGPNFKLQSEYRSPRPTPRSTDWPARSVWAKAVTVPSNPGLARQQPAVRAAQRFFVFYLGRGSTLFSMFRAVAPRNAKKPPLEDGDAFAVANIPSLDSARTRINSAIQISRRRHAQASIVPQITDVIFGFTPTHPDFSPTRNLLLIRAFGRSANRRPDARRASRWTAAVTASPVATIRTTSRARVMAVYSS